MAKNNNATLRRALRILTFIRRIEYGSIAEFCREKDLALSTISKLESSLEKDSCPITHAMLEKYSSALDIPYADVLSFAQDLEDQTSASTKEISNREVVYSFLQFLAKRKQSRIVEA